MPEPAAPARALTEDARGASTTATGTGASAPDPVRGRAFGVPAPDSARGRAFAWALGLLLLGLSLSPMARPTGYDSFPFSSFPMFAHGRKDAVTTVHRALAELPDGTTLPLPPRALGSDEVLQADTTLRHAIRRGKKASDGLCRAIARRVAADPSLAAGAVAVQLVSARHDAIAYFAGDTDPLEPPKRRARCKVARP